MSDLADIRAALADLQRSMGRVEAHVKEALADNRDFDKRIRRVENRQHWYSGAAAAVGAVVAYLTKTHG